jgi:hypothetical protein
VEQIRESLNRQATILVSLQNGVVRQMEEHVRSLGKKTAALEENLKFNHAPLNESIRLILTEVTKAQDYLNTTASKEIKKVSVDTNFTPADPSTYATRMTLPIRVRHSTINPQQTRRSNRISNINCNPIIPIYKSNFKGKQFYPLNQIIFSGPTSGRSLMLELEHVGRGLTWLITQDGYTGCFIKNEPI